MLFDIHHKPMQEQKEYLDNFLHKWMTASNEPQVDDIMVMGFKL